MERHLTHPGAVSYRPEAEHGGLDAEARRLDHQAALTWAHEWRVLRDLAPERGRILDAGCGTGSFTRLLRRELPEAGVTGLDADPRLLDRAAAASASGGAGVRWVRGDLTVPPLPPGMFDLVLSRYVFQHLPAPVEAARALAGLLRPGGVLAVVDVDAQLWGTADPDLGSLSADAYRALGAAQSAGGGDRLIARRLPRILRRAGLTGIEVRPFAYTSDEVGLAALAPQLSPERLLPLVERGLIGLGEYARATAAWNRFTADDGFVLLLGFVVLGRAPC